jgi:hypothetical protein
MAELVHPPDGFVTDGIRADEVDARDAVVSLGAVGVQRGDLGASPQAQPNSPSAPRCRVRGPAVERGAPG